MLSSKAASIPLSAAISADVPALVEPEKSAVLM
jgi:hypothetical protein